MLPIPSHAPSVKGSSPMKRLLLLAICRVPGSLFSAAAWAAAPTAEQALKLTPVQPGVDYDRPTPSKRQVQDHRQADRRPHGLDRREPGGRDFAEVRRYGRRQGRGPVELLQGRAGGLPRHRLEAHRQGRSVPLVPYGRHAVGARSGRHRSDPVLEANLARGSRRRDRGRDGRAKTTSGSSG